MTLTGIYSNLPSKLDKFKGRVCTILTGPTGLHITDPIRHAQFFTGRVTEVDNYGIWLKHLTTDTISFFMYPLAGIVEEQFIPDSDPRAPKLKEEMEKAIKPKQVTPTPPVKSSCCGGGGGGDFIPIDQLTKAVRDGKNAAKV